jgi:hypothetical protein
VCSVPYHHSPALFCIGFQIDRFIFSITIWGKALSGQEDEQGVKEEENEKIPAA